LRSAEGEAPAVRFPETEKRCEPRKTPRLMEKSELDDGKIYRNHPIWGKNPWVSSRFSLPPIH
jgi:hypothetical protein